jgi:hypothetical protein
VRDHSLAIQSDRFGIGDANRHRDGRHNQPPPDANAGRRSEANVGGHR